MWIKFGVGMRMVQAVHDAIGPWAQVRGALRDIGKYKEELLPGFAHGKRFMGSITVLKKRLRKQG